MKSVAVARNKPVALETKRNNWFEDDDERSRSKWAIDRHLWRKIVTRFVSDRKQQVGEIPNLNRE
jgi:hypothetical protein